MKERKTKSNTIGHLGELIAADFLMQKGYTLLEQNKRYKTGEIDLIMTHPEQGVCFVEVKTKSCTSTEFEKDKRLLMQNPIEQLHQKKLHKLHKAIFLYLQSTNNTGAIWQLDAVLVLYCEEKNEAYCEHLEYISLDS